MNEKVKEVAKLYVKAQETYQEELSYRGDVSNATIRAKARMTTLLEVMKILDPENELDI